MVATVCSTCKRKLRMWSVCPNCACNLCAQIAHAVRVLKLRMQSVSPNCACGLCAQIAHAVCELKLRTRSVCAICTCGLCAQIAHEVYVRNLYMQSVRASCTYAVCVRNLYMQSVCVTCTSSLCAQFVHAVCVLKLHMLSVCMICTCSLCAQTAHAVCARDLYMQSFCHGQAKPPPPTPALNKSQRGVVAEPSRSLPLDWPQAASLRGAMVHERAMLRQPHPLAATLSPGYWVPADEEPSCLQGCRPHAQHQGCAIAHQYLQAYMPPT